MKKFLCFSHVKEPYSFRPEYNFIAINTSQILYILSVEKPGNLKYDIRSEIHMVNGDVFYSEIPQAKLLETIGVDSASHFDLEKVRIPAYLFQKDAHKEI